jgi:UDP-glucose 4-epimerase
MNQQTVLVTGADGFIGSHLVELLLAEGNHVKVIDDFSSSSLKNISKVVDHKSLSIIKGSILDANLVRESLKGVNKCFHLAASLGVSNIVNNPIKALEVNVKGSEIVLGQAADLKIRTVLTSTSEIYGRNPVNPLREDSDRVLGSPKISRWTYSEAKALDEFMAFQLHKEIGFQVTIARLFNTVGPRQVGNYGMVLPRFIECALNNEALIVFGDGLQTRTFSAVSEVITALNLLSKTSETIGEVYNLGSPHAISMIDLAKKVIKLTNSNSTIIVKPYEELFGKNFEEPRERVPEVTKIFKAIGWTAMKSIDEIIVEIANTHSS